MEAELQQMIDYVHNHYQKMQIPGPIIARALADYSSADVEAACSDLLGWILLREVAPSQIKLKMNINWERTKALTSIIKSSDCLSSIIAIDDEGAFDYCQGTDEEGRNVYRYVREHFHPEVLT